MNNTNIQRNFIIGDEWNYLKIYTGFKTADTILTHCIYPMITFLKGNKIIDKWFFLRYADPEFHLRIRFHVNNPNYISVVMMNVNKALKKYVNNNLVWKVQIDTYKRELERYGLEAMELSETLFWYDSEMICNIIASDVIKQDENLRCLLGLKMIDTLLTDFGYSLQEKWDLINISQERFKKEFGINAVSKRQFGQKYRILKSYIEKILDTNAEQEELYSSLFIPIHEKSKATESIVEEIKKRMRISDNPSITDLLYSYIHIMLNRLILTQPRMHELVLYDYLFRYYNSLLARQGGKTKEITNHS